MYFLVKENGSKTGCFFFVSLFFHRKDMWGVVFVFQWSYGRHIQKGGEDVSVDGGEKEGGMDAHPLLYSAMHSIMCPLMPSPG
jgi:hypothetical protein